MLETFLHFFNGLNKLPSVVVFIVCILYCMFDLICIIYKLNLFLDTTLTNGRISRLRLYWIARSLHHSFFNTPTRNCGYGSSCSTYTCTISASNNLQCEAISSLSLFVAFWSLKGYMFYIIILPKVYPRLPGFSYIYMNVCCLLQLCQKYVVGLNWFGAIQPQNKAKLLWTNLLLTIKFNCRYVLN